MSMAKSLAHPMAKGPAERFASITLTAKVSWINSRLALGFISPLSMILMYIGMRLTPCVSMPRKLAQMRASATLLASSWFMPLACKISLLKSFKRSALKVGENGEGACRVIVVQSF